MATQSADETVLDPATSQSLDAPIAIPSNDNTVSNELSPAKVTSSPRISIIPVKITHNRYARIHQLPPEILVSVFHFDLDAHPYSTHSCSIPKGRVSRIVLLSSVCSRWRNLVVGSKLLWTRIGIPLHGSRSLVAMCIARAQDGPLDIVAIQHEKKGAWRHADEVWRREPALQGHMKNIRSLSLVTDISRPIHSTIERIRGVDTKELCGLQELFVVFARRELPHPYSAIVAAPSRIPLDLEPFADQLRTLYLQRVSVNWSKCTFDRLCVLRLKDVDTLDAIELRHILASSPVLQVLDLGGTRLEPRMRKPEPVVLPNLNILRLLYLDEDSIRTIIDVLAPGTYNVELYIYAMSAKQTDTDAVSNTPHIFRALAHNITVLGVAVRTETLDELLAAVTVALPNLVTLRFDHFTLSQGCMDSIEAMVEKFPHTKKIRIARSIVSDAEVFKGMLQRCSVERRIELVDISVGPSAGHEGADISTTLYEWILTHTPNVSFLDGRRPSLIVYCSRQNTNDM
ncbi:F-box-like, partial [Rhizoctonia solani]